MVARVIREMSAAEGSDAATAGSTRCSSTSSTPPPPTIFVIPVAGSHRQVREKSRTSTSPPQ